MYIVTLNLGGKDYTLKTEKRPLARNTYLLCKENDVKCEVNEEVKPRLVKFKGTD